MPTAFTLGWKDNRITMLAEDYDYVIGGNPDRDTIDLAVLHTGTGGVHALAHPVRIPNQQTPTQAAREVHVAAAVGIQPKRKQH